jgi:hypothetical protein
VKESVMKRRTHKVEPGRASSDSVAMWSRRRAPSHCWWLVSSTKLAWCRSGSSFVTTSPRSTKSCACYVASASSDGTNPSRVPTLLHTTCPPPLPGVQTEKKPPMDGSGRMEVMRWRTVKMKKRQSSGW